MTVPSVLRIAEAPRTLREIALDKVRSAILDQYFPPGTRLTERDLGEQLGVSRTVVREVIRHLESEGLVQSIPNQGPIVARLDPATAAEIYELRGLLEAAAASAAALAADANAIEQMREALAQIRAAYTLRDFRKVGVETTRFYEAIFLSGKKRVAWDMVQRLNGRISILRSMTIASPGREQKGPEQLPPSPTRSSTKKAIDQPNAVCRNGALTAFTRYAQYESGGGPQSFSTQL